MKGISLQISNEEGESISPELLEILTREGWTIDNIEMF